MSNLEFLFACMVETRRWRRKLDCRSLTFVLYSDVTDAAIRRARSLEVKP